jgi:thiol:disulfide interchange protein DsbA
VRCQEFAVVKLKLNGAVFRLGTFITLALSLSLFATKSTAQPMALPEFVAGEHYEVLASPLKLAADDKIEVMEVFWYGCSHCMSFEPVVRAWKKNLADDVEFMRTPAIWGRKGSKNNDLMLAHARLYYAVEALDLPDAIHDDLFKMVVANRNLSKMEQFAPVFVKHGADQEAFAGVFDSFSLKHKANQAANRLGANYATQGTPELVVNGRYRISGKMAGGQAKMLDVVNYLIEQERERTK